MSEDSDDFKIRCHDCKNNKTWYKCSTCETYFCPHCVTCQFGKKYKYYCHGCYECKKNRIVNRNKKIHYY